MVIFLDKELIKKYCKDADIVHHLAGDYRCAQNTKRVKANDKNDEILN